MSYFSFRKSLGLCGLVALSLLLCLADKDAEAQRRDWWLKAHKELVVASGWEARPLDVYQSIINRNYPALQMVGD